MAQADIVIYANSLHRRALARSNHQHEERLETSWSASAIPMSRNWILPALSKSARRPGASDLVASCTVERSRPTGRSTFNKIARLSDIRTRLSCVPGGFGNRCGDGGRHHWLSIRRLAGNGDTDVGSGMDPRPPAVVGLLVGKRAGASLGMCCTDAASA